MRSVLVRCSLPSLLLAALVVAPSAARAAVAHADTAVFAGGCFWSMEVQFAGIKGVRGLIVGYTGGHKDHPTYEEVCSHTTGHLEALQVVYDPGVVGYDQLLDRYWHSIDPTQGDGQFCDVGDSYRPAIFYRNAAQRAQAEASKQRLDASHVLHAPNVTAIRPASTFWPAEAYHQDYWRKNPQHYHAYREGCGRDAQLVDVWGAAAAKPLVY